MDDHWKLAQDRLTEGDAVGALRDFLRFEAEGLCLLESREYPGLRRLVASDLTKDIEDSLLLLDGAGVQIADLSRPGPARQPPTGPGAGAYVDACPLPKEQGTPRVLLWATQGKGTDALHIYRVSGRGPEIRLHKDRVALSPGASIEAVCCRDNEVLVATQDGHLWRHNAVNLRPRDSVPNPLPLKGLVPGPRAGTFVGLGRDQGLCLYTFAPAGMTPTPFGESRRFRAVAIGDLRDFGAPDIVAITRGGAVLAFDGETLDLLFEASIPEEPLALCCVPGDRGDRVVVGGASGGLYALAVNDKPELVQTQGWDFPHRIAHIAPLRRDFRGGDRALAVGLETGEVRIFGVPSHRSLSIGIQGCLRALRQRGPRWAADLLGDEDPRVPAYALSLLSGDIECKDLTAFLGGIGPETPALSRVIGGLKALLDRHRDRCHTVVGDAAFHLLERLSQGPEGAGPNEAACSALEDIVRQPGLWTERAQKLLIEAQGRRNRFLVMRPRLRARLLKLAGHLEDRGEAEQIADDLTSHGLDLIATAPGSGRVVALAIGADGSGPLYLRAEGECGRLDTNLSPLGLACTGVDAMLPLPDEAGGGCILFSDREALYLGADLAGLKRFALTAPVRVSCLTPGPTPTWVAAGGHRVLYGNAQGQSGEVATQEPLVALVPLAGSQPGARSSALGVSATGGLYRLELPPRTGGGQPGPLAPWQRIEPALNALGAVPGPPGQALVIGSRGLVLVRGLPARADCLARPVPSAPVCAVRLPHLGSGQPEWLVATRDRGLQFLGGDLKVHRITHLDDIATALCCSELGADGPHLYVGCARGNILGLDLLGPEGMAEVRRLGDQSHAWSDKWGRIPCAAQLALVGLGANDPSAHPGAADLYSGLDPRIQALVSFDGLLDGLRDLQALGLVAAEGADRYRFQSQALRRWVAARHSDPFDVIRGQAQAIVAGWTLAELARVQAAAEVCRTPHWPSEAFGIEPSRWARAARIADLWLASEDARGAERLVRLADLAKALADLLGATLNWPPEGEDPGPYWASLAFPWLRFQGFDDLRLVFPGDLRDQDLPGALGRLPRRGAALPRIILLLTRSQWAPAHVPVDGLAADIATLDGTGLAATALDSSPVQRFLDALIPQIDLAALSPFQTAGPVRETFSGREAERHRILGYILRREGKGCAVIGPRRIGKTSLLLRVQDELRQDPQIEVHFLDPSPYGSELGLLLGAIHQKLGMEGGPSDGAGFIAAIRKRLKANPRRRLALFIDEVDALVGPADRSPLPDVLRSLSNELGVAVVLAGYRVLYDQMKDLGSALFNLLEPIELGRLDEPAAMALVADNLRPIYDIDTELVRDLVTRTGLYPNFIQTACVHLIARKGRTGDRSIRRDDIQAIIQSQDLFDHLVRFYIANLDERTQAALFLLVSLYDPKQGAFVVSRERLERNLKAGFSPQASTKLSFDKQFTRYDLHRIFEVHGVSLSPSALETLLRRLVLASVIAPVPDTGKYAFTLPDLPMVLRRHVDAELMAVHYAERLTELFGTGEPR